MKDNLINNNNNFYIGGTPNRNNSYSLVKDNDDIIKQLSQITPSDNKSFESSLILSHNIPKFFEFKSDEILLSKDNNIPSEEENSLTNNNHLILNKKYKYICSIIQSSNFNIKNYDNLRNIKKYLNINLQTLYEPINILLDVIIELIFCIQKELKNNNILMKEIKRLKYNESNNGKTIYNLNSLINEKDKELNSLKLGKKEDKSQNEINILKKENSKLLKKLNIYKTKIKNVESNNEKILSKLNSFNRVNKINCKKRNNLLNNKLYSSNIQTLNEVVKLNNSYDDTKCDIFKNSLTTQNTNFNFYNNANNYKTINYNSNTSPINRINKKNSLNGTNNTYYNIINNRKNEENNNYRHTFDSSNISNMKNLLKEINGMLNVYNSTLDKIKINDIIKNDSKNETIDSDNMRNINVFLNKMDNKMKIMENYMKENQRNKSSIHKKLIQVNTSRWTFRKKNEGKKEIKQNNSLNSEKANEKSCTSLNNRNIYRKKNVINLYERNRIYGYNNKNAIIKKENE